MPLKNVKPQASRQSADARADEHNSEGLEAPGEDNVGVDVGVPKQRRAISTSETFPEPRKKSNMNAVGTTVRGLQDLRSFNDKRLMRRLCTSIQAY